MDEDTLVGSDVAGYRIEALLATLRAHGHAELAVEVRIITGSQAVLNVDGVDWQMIGAGGTGSASDDRAGSAEPRGTVRSVVERSLPAMLALIGEILTEAQKIARAVEPGDVTLRVNPDVAKVLKSNQNAYLQEIEETLKRNVIVKSDPQLHQERFDLA